MATPMNKALLAILLFAGLLLLITSPFATFAGLMILVLVAALFSTVWTVVQVLADGGTKRDSP